MSKLKNAVLAGAVLTGIAVSWIVLQREQTALRRDRETFRKQAVHIEQLKADNERLSSLLAQTVRESAQLADLPRLRAEASALRNRTNELAVLNEEHRALRTALQSRPATKEPPQTRQEVVAKLNFSKEWLLAFHQYAEDHQGDFPASFESAAYRLANGGAPRPDSTVVPEQFEIVYLGKLNALTNPAATIVFREREARPMPNGSWMKVYGFADGHAEGHIEPDGNFEEWERARIIPPSPQQD